LITGPCFSGSLTAGASFGYVVGFFGLAVFDENTLCLKTGL